METRLSLPNDPNTANTTSTGGRMNACVDVTAIPRFIDPKQLLNSQIRRDSSNRTLEPAARPRLSPNTVRPPPLNT